LSGAIEEVDSNTGQEVPVSLLVATKASRSRRRRRRRRRIRLPQSEQSKRITTKKEESLPQLPFPQSAQGALLQRWVSARRLRCESTHLPL
jgi:hypothetical protein